MLSTSLQTALGQLFSQKLNTAVHSLQFQKIGGGSINDTYKAIVNQSNAFFVKINSAHAFPDLFVKEKNGLEYIGKKGLIKVPEVVDCSIINNQQVLILEWIENGERTDAFWKKFGQQLAGLHSISNEQFGWTEDNYMGSVVQLNNPCSIWSQFFVEQRLQPVVRQCFNKKLLQIKHLQSFEKLYARVPALFEPEPPALVHGDLWGGNFMCNPASEPVLIDPAVYFGHRSVDLAMTTLFGGFPTSFYDAYQYYFPFPKNYMQQWKVCNLYPILIHLLLFGSSYITQTEEILMPYS